MSRTIGLVACTYRKQANPMPARDLYTSAWFRKASAYAEQRTDAWYILSAKHGLVPPDRVTAPYEEALSRMSAEAQRAWAGRVLDALAEVLHPGDHVVMLAGERHCLRLVDPIRQMGCTVEIPLRGLRMGEQLHWLNIELGAA